MADVTPSHADAAHAVPIVALDFAMAETALQMVSLLGDRCGFYKVGSELFTAVGPQIVREIVRRGKRVFLDLKFDDIPNTVGKATAAAVDLGASIVTVHASGGEAMVRAAVASAGDSCEIFAVTVLTSLDVSAYSAITGRKVTDLVPEIERLARLAERAGAAGVVCSGLEAGPLRSRFGAGLKLLVPGVRLPGIAPGDQSRVVTPAQAAAAGASYIILGRTVISAPDPVKAMEEAVASLG